MSTVLNGLISWIRKFVIELVIAIARCDLAEYLVFAANIDDTDGWGLTSGSVFTSVCDHAGRGDEFGEIKLGWFARTCDVKLVVPPLYFTVLLHI